VNDEERSEEKLSEDYEKGQGQCVKSENEKA
jgi:hypothetical protein